jgi:CRISPR-associated endonuclease/helicase Cas3
MTTFDRGSSFRHWWGKARPIEGARFIFHPNWCHGLDVAAVAGELMVRLPALASRIGRPLGLDGPACRSLVLTLAALHDIGKFTLAFQLKEPGLWPAQSGRPPRNAPWQMRHDAAGLLLLHHAAIGGLLSEHLGPRWPDLSLGMLPAVAGHHGKPVPSETVSIDRLAPPGLLACTVDFARQVLDLIRPTPLGDGATAPSGLRWERAGQLSSWPLSGLMVLADWIGSNQDWFPYADPSADFAGYFEEASDRARMAVDMAGIARAAGGAYRGVSVLVDGRPPSPMQRFLDGAAIPSGPGLTIIEDVTGSGKTEAAVALAWRLIAAGHAEGVMMALPTMATANAMFDRIARHARTFFAEESTPSLSLAHGRSRLHDAFRAIALGGGLTAAETDAERAEDSALVCPVWIASETRRAFLADLGIATVDQALLAVLAAKYQSLRLGGLVGKVLIVDEVHAYDSYMLAELDRLLTFHAALGGSAILLSATLPLSRRQRLAKAFAEGLGRPAPALSATGFPLATAIDGAGESETALPVREELARRVRVRLVHDVEEAHDLVAEADRRGAAVAYLRNTVDDVLDTADALAARGIDATVFHARFTAGDRQAIEADILTRFGPASGEERRGVVVASQVIEQSLDLDFDLFVTDLAPIDLIIQRAGRLWRHRRTARPVDVPELVVVSPRPATDAGKDWLKSLFPRAGGIYPNHARLWLTAKLLAEKGVIATPDDSRALIEAVYGGNAIAAAPPALERMGLEAEGQDLADAAVAYLNLLRLKDGYSRSTGAWVSDVRTPTRLGDERTTIRLGRWVGKELRPFADDRDPVRAWALSEISVRRNWLGTPPDPPADVTAAIAREKARWPAFERDLRLLPMNDAESHQWWSVDGSFTYHRKRGLTKPVENSP